MFYSLLKDMYHKFKLRLASDTKKAYSMDGHKCVAKIVNVYDGDTFKACLYHEKKVKKLTFRPIGYDTPEMRPPKKMENRELHIQKAKEAREYLCQLFGGIGGYIFIHCHGYDKYGRVLCTMYKSRWKRKKSINQMMLDSGQGIKYEGGTKTQFPFELSVENT